MPDKKLNSGAGENVSSLLQTINNLTLERSNLIAENNRLQAAVENYKQVAENQQKVTLDRGFEIKRLKEENEELHKKYDDTVLLEGNMVRQIHELLINAKAEAYKEFAERLKSKMDLYIFGTHCKTFTQNDIDNLLKELVGENDG